MPAVLSPSDDIGDMRRFSLGLFGPNRAARRPSAVVRHGVGTLARWLSLAACVCASACGDDEGGPPPVEADAGADAGPDHSECEVAFVTPEPRAGRITLGRGDDVDAEACGSELSTSVRVASTGQRVRLFVNGMTSSALEADVSGLIAAFPAVPLTNTGEQSNTLRAVATLRDGRRCEATLDTELYVDCEAPSCVIASPRDTTHLGTSHGSATAEGLSLPLEVATDEDNAGQRVYLTVDGDLDARLEAEVDADGVASFADVTLAEGLRRVQAECRDAAGNVARSPVVEWTVDATPCTLSVEPPEVVTPALDTDDAAGIQLALSGAVEGQGCGAVRFGACGGKLSSLGAGAIGADGSFQLPLSIPAENGAYSLCVEVEDDAGNVRQVSVPLERRVNAPEVAIAAPASGTSINRAGDLTPATAACDVAFSVLCSEVGRPVQLMQGSSVLASANCAADSSVSAPYRGRASFASVALTSRNDGSSTSITAVQSVAGLVGTSAPISVQPDCEPPQVTFGSSLPCGGQLSLTGHDDDPDVPGLQFPLVVFNGGVPAVVLTRALGAGAPITVNPSSSTAAATFFDVDFGNAETTAQLTACATDAQGNQGCAPACSVELANVPLVTITSPGPGDTLSLDDECAAGTVGLQVLVTGRVDAQNGSTVEVEIGDSPPTAGTVTGGLFSVCSNAFDNGVNKTLRVTVVDSARPLAPGSASVIVNVDGVAPSTPVPAPTVLQVVSRREGVVRLRWSAVPDAGNTPLASYELRCADAPIEDQGDWEAASSRSISVTPKTSGSEQADVAGFRVGTTAYCAVRGVDLGGSLTPLPATPSAAVTIPFEQREYTGLLDSSGRTFATVAPLGDINGDGYDDFAYGAQDAGVQVFFGGPALDTTADIKIDGVFGALGAVVAGLGDISGDGRPDFAVSAWNQNGGAGTVFVFFGRAANDPWDANTVVADQPCTGADLCIRGTASNGLLGWDVTSADFDGNGTLDLVVSAPRAQGNGRVFVLAGGADLVSAGPSIDLPNANPAANPNGFVLAPPAGVSDLGMGIANVGAGADARHDLVLGANGFSGSVAGAALFAAGQAQVGSGLVSITLSNAAKFDTGASGVFGMPVRALGDHDGDGRADVAVGASTALGQVEVFRRGAGNGGFSAASSFLMTNDTGELVTFGAYLAGGFHPSFGTFGDLDGDGLGELCVGAFGTTGSADLFYGDVGAGARSRSLADFRFHGGEGDILPSFVGDIDGDGHPDLAVLEFNPFSDPGVVTKLTLLY